MTPNIGFNQLEAEVVIDSGFRAADADQIINWG